MSVEVPIGPNPFRRLVSNVHNAAQRARIVLHDKTASTQQSAKELSEQFQITAALALDRALQLLPHPTSPKGIIVMALAGLMPYLAYQSSKASLAEILASTPPAVAIPAMNYSQEPFMSLYQAPEQLSPLQSTIPTDNLTILSQQPETSTQPSQSTRSFQQAKLGEEVTDNINTGSAQEIKQTPNVSLVTDQTTIDLLNAYVQGSSVKMPDFTSPELASLSPDIQNAVSASRVAIIDPSRQDGLFAHGSFLVDKNGNLFLLTVSHVVQHLMTYLNNNEQLAYKPPGTLFFAISTQDGVHYFNFTMSGNRLLNNSKNYQDGLVMVSLIGIDYNKIPHFNSADGDYLTLCKSNKTEDGLFSSFVYLTNGGLNLLEELAKVNHSNLGSIIANKSSEASPSNGDSGTGVFALDSKTNNLVLIGSMQGIFEQAEGLLENLEETTAMYPIINSASSSTP
jgi:hypothetical protein